MTFTNDSFDIFVTQDVFEHVLNPDLAFCEIARVLKQGGTHIFTMPWYPDRFTEFRVVPNNEEGARGGVLLLKDPVYHGNPIDEQGSIVTVDWGIDFVDYIYRNSAMTTMIYLHENKDLGLEAELLHVFVSSKT
jgi:SAM-dependent methyltransferase